MAIKVGMVSLGCPKNQVDAEHMLSDLKEDQRFELTPIAEDADAVIINTCAFIDSAKKESIDTILEFADEKNKQLKCIAVTGCLAERYKQELSEEMPEIDIVLGIGSNDKLADAIFESVDSKKKTISFSDKLNLKLDHYRVLTTPSTYAYLKIAEGCDNRCTYCAIPEIRGEYRSRKMTEILDEAHWLARQGVREIIIVAQDTSCYGKDLYGEYKLADLLREVCKFGFLWVRVLYCYPEKITDELIDVFAQQSNLLPYIDMPIQHINDGVLKRMNRNTSKKEILEVIAKLRENIPNVTLRTSLIAGFPGETQQQFEELIDFVKDVKFDRLGCFAYSKEEGTPAAKLKDQIDEETKQRRAELVMLEQQRILEEKGKELIGKTIRVMVENQLDDINYVGRSTLDAPEIDCSVYFTSENIQASPGNIVAIKIEKEELGDLYGKIFDSNQGIEGSFI